MTDTIAKLLRTVLVAGIALLGMIMAAVLVVSTAVALAIVYVVARLRGKPFAAQTYWKRSQGRWGFGEPAAPAEAGRSRSQAARGGYNSRIRRNDIIDVEVRDIP
ncbi:hypothetical protein PIGHUM_02254 [Pigmentiphaga humi]|uniref:Uncharacterized protein n=1 Tax=Pigmentiphaga humi TaxID=2478468 RepID=A0A3P4B1L2_9BURK|nr:hypothetical protein [Pigmentiphaga humi]VCU70187.1 hypothetical protein PIGHUM_02254 [Pigmentiphaga humi]